MTKNVPLTGGASATLNGLAFATYDLTPTGTIGGGDCGTTSWTAKTTLTCRSEAATDLYGAAVVTVAAVPGTLVASAFSFDGSPLAFPSQRSTPVQPTSPVLRGRRP